MKDSWQYINYGALFLVFHLDHWALISVSLATFFFSCPLYIQRDRTQPRSRRRIYGRANKMEKHINRRNKGFQKQSVHLCQSLLEAARQNHPAIPSYLDLEPGFVFPRTAANFTHCMPALELKPLPRRMKVITPHGLKTQKSFHPNRRSAAVNPRAATRSTLEGEINYCAVQCRSSRAD